MMTEELSFTNGFDAITTDPQEAAELATRSDLILILYKIINHHRWTPTEAAVQLNTTEAVTTLTIILTKVTYEKRNH